MNQRTDVHCGDIVELQEGWLGVLATVTAVELSPDGERILKVRLKKTTRHGCVTTWMNYNTFLRKTKRMADRDTEIRGVEEAYSQPGLFGDVPARERRIEKAVRA